MIGSIAEMVKTTTFYITKASNWLSRGCHTSRFMLHFCSCSSLLMSVSGTRRYLIKGTSISVFVIGCWMVNLRFGTT